MTYSDRLLPEFRRLVDTHRLPLYRLAIDLTGDHDEAEDLLQEVFVRAWRGLDAFRGEADPGTWLRRITVNAFLNTRRSARLELVRLETDGSAAEPAAPEPTRDAGDARRIQEAISRALDGLSPGERTAFVLRHYQELPVREVARAMGVAEGTAKSLLFRATHKLAGRLAHLQTEIQS